MRRNLIEARKNKRLTQTELGELVGLTTQFICDLERGRSKGSVTTWDALEAVLKVDQRVLRETDSSN